MTHQEAREQIQEDLRCLLGTLPVDQAVIDNACQIVVDNFRKMRPHWRPVSPWEKHAQYPVEDWTDEVSAGDTRLGYIDWVNVKIQAAVEGGD